MKVLVVHNPYEHPGGEDVHVGHLLQAYRRLGWNPILFPQDRSTSNRSVAKTAASLLPFTEFAELQAVWDAEAPRFLHLHNAFPNLGPRLFRWIAARGIDAAMTVHNHRFYCANGLALRDGKVCKACLPHRVAWRPLAYNCNGSRIKSAYHAIASTELRLGDFYAQAIRLFIAPSPYIRNELLAFGVPPEKIAWIMNPVFPPHKNEETAPPTDVLYAGRLAQEKGIGTLLETIRRMPDTRFTIAGEGPEQARVAAFCATQANARYVGRLSATQVSAQLLMARVGVLTSICNEILPTFALEAFAHGRYCVVPDLESTRWLADRPFLGIRADPRSSSSVEAGLRAALAAPPPRAADLEQLQTRLSFQRFCEELASIMKRWLV